MSGAKKAGKKLFKGAKNVVSKVVDASLHPGITVKKLTSKVVDPITGMMNPKMPEQADAPLMPDYESIEKDRRRRRTAKMGRSETIMSDSLG